jgi:hypothetical protein
MRILLLMLAVGALGAWVAVPLAGDTEGGAGPNHTTECERWHASYGIDTQTEAAPDWCRRMPI